MTRKLRFSVRPHLMIPPIGCQLWRPRNSIDRGWRQRRLPLKIIGQWSRVHQAHCQLHILLARSVPVRKYSWLHLHRSNFWCEIKCDDKTSLFCAIGNRYVTPRRSRRSLNRCSAVGYVNSRRTVGLLKARIISLHSSAKTFIDWYFGHCPLSLLFFPIRSFSKTSSVCFIRWQDKSWILLTWAL
jgi:hypothetical protein